MRNSGSRSGGRGRARSRPELCERPRDLFSSKRPAEPLSTRIPMFDVRFCLVIGDYATGRFVSSTLGYVSQMTPAAALSVARQFHRAFELCRGNGLTAADGKSNVDIPGVVNLAFAIELGLKASHFSYKDAVRGHRLDQLYHALPQLDQEFIAHRSSLGKDKIEADLPHVANAFQDWRYIHEEVGIITISLQFLMLFWHGVDDLAETKRQGQLEALRQSQK